MQRKLEINGGRVVGGPPYQFYLPSTAAGYADAQIDDYGPGTPSGSSGLTFRWRPGTTLELRARFSHSAEALQGTAGFGFWNAPFGDPTVRRPALPQAVWFFFASPPNDLPFAPDGPGRGWFTATIDARRPSALAMIPLAPFVLLGNQLAPLRRRLWPFVQRQLGISFQPLPTSMKEWHIYRLEWLSTGCAFYVDDELHHQTPFSPRGPLGFVCWIDNQYMVLTPRGRFASGVLSIQQAQWMEINDLSLNQATAQHDD
jgi:hypothetical protein